MPRRVRRKRCSRPAPRRIDLDRFPKTHTCLKFEFEGEPEGKRHYWIIGDNTGLELCITDPGYPVDLYVTTDTRTMTLVWNGDLPLRAMIDEGRIDLHGPTALMRAFPDWLQLSLFAVASPGCWRLLTAAQRRSLREQRGGRSSHSVPSRL